MARHTRSRNVGREYQFRYGAMWEGIRLRDMRTRDRPYATQEELPSIAGPIKFYTWPKKDMVWIGGKALNLYFYTHPDKR